MSTFGIKRIKVVINVDNPVVTSSGEITNRIKDAIFSGDGDVTYERIYGRCRELKTRIKTLSDIDILKIGTNHSTYCMANGITEELLLRSGELQIGENKNFTSRFPINNIVILRDNGIAIENVTSLCSIDKINGEVTIPLPQRTGIFSFIYSHKNVSIVGNNALQIPSTNNFGISTITT